MGAGMIDDKNRSESLSMEHIWARVRHRLEQELGSAAFQSWLRPVQFGSIQGEELLLIAPTRFLRDWVESRYGELIVCFWREEDSSVSNLNIEVRKQKIVETKGLPSPSNQKFQSPSERLSLHLMDTDDSALGSPLSPKFKFNNFVLGKPNEFAHAAARRVAESDKVPFNPLYLYGGVGLGKTHLMHAIAWHIRERDPGRRVIYLSAEKFMYQFIRALRFKDTMAFKEQFRSADVLLIDDVQFICGKESTQEEFFHTFNALVDHDRQVVISGDRSPSDLDAMEERLRSRLGWGLVADIHATTYELRLGILQTKAEAMDASSLPREVLEFLAYKITSNVRELEMALNRVAAHATLIGRAVSLEMTQEVLRDVLRANDRRVTIEEIQKRVAEHYNIKLSEMSSERRARAVARPRQVAMFLSKQLTQRSLPEIGRKFGGRDHTTVMHAVRKIEQLKESDLGIAEDLELLKRNLEA
jgi:chromosomal replication initiator protein